MKKLVNVFAKIMVMAAVFAITVVFVNNFQNRYYNHDAVELASSTLPLVYVNYEDTYINLLHGYTTSVDTTLLRDAITPISSDKQITIEVDDDSAYATSYSYEVRNVSGSSLIENGELSPALTQNGNNVFNIDIRMDIDSETEYMFIFLITNESGDVARYYTRIVVNEDYHAAELLAYVDEFNALTFNLEIDDTVIDDEEEEVLSEIEQAQAAYTSTEEDANLTMGHFTLASSLENICWSGVDHQVVTSVIPTIKEIDINYAVIELDYVTQTVDEDGGVDYYQINEYYRVSYDEEEGITLMNFDRYIDEYFNRTEIDTQKNVYEIGIVSDEEVQYVSSSDNKRISFVRNGQLWLYNYAKNEISLVFSFWIDDVENIRDTYADYDINIITMDNDGNITFAIYGYMNRGEHEGRLGISLCTFDAETFNVTELLFVECDQTYDAMKDEVSRLTYYDGENFYFMLGGKITCVNVEKKQASTFVEGISMDSVYVADSMDVIVYCASDEQISNNQLTMVNFKTGETYTFKAGTGKCIICYDFKDTDFIYGVCYTADADMSFNAKSFAKSDLEEEDYANIPAFKLVIVDEDGNTLKEYQKDLNYLLKVTIDAGYIYMTRGIKSGSEFLLTSDDFITFKEDDSLEHIETVSKTSALGVKKLYFSMPSSIYLTYEPYLYITRISFLENSNLLVSVDSVTGYMVYSNLGLYGIYDTAGEAIVDAVDVSGIVVSSDGEIVYRKRDALEYNTIASAITHYSTGTTSASLTDCVYMVLLYQGAAVTYDQVAAYDDPVEALTALGKYDGADVSGISLDLVVAYVGDGIPVISRIDDGRYVLVVSYNSEAIRYYDPVLGDEVKVTRSSYTKSMNLWDSELYTYFVK